MIVSRHRGRTIIVRQTEHARLAGLLAEAWDLDALLGHTVPPLMRERTVEAVLHHDDGWMEWEREPTLDDAGLPLDFKNMPASEHSEIWRRSVNLAAERHPWVGALVAMHAQRLYEELPDPDIEPTEHLVQKSLAEWLAAAVDSLLEKAAELPEPCFAQARPRAACYGAVVSFFDALTLMMLHAVGQSEFLSVEATYALDWADDVVRLTPWHLQAESLRISCYTTDDRAISWRIEKG